MLLELGVENFALIRRASISLAPGLTVLTGETGAGKSLLVQALKMILGVRANPQQIRTGAEQAVVQALMELPPEKATLLDEMGIPAEEGVVIRRIIPRNGRGRIYVNGALVNLQGLQTLAAGAVSLAGQHEFQELLRPDRQALWLDRFGGLETDALTVSRSHHSLKAERAEFEESVRQEAASAAALEALTAEAAEIDAAEPKAGEDDLIEQERKVLKASASLRSLGETCYRTLYADTGSALEQLAECRHTLERMNVLDQSLETLLADLNGAVCQVQEVAWTLRDYLGRLPADLSRLELIEERLHRLKELKRRFGPSLEEVLRHRESLRAKITDLTRKGEGRRDWAKRIEAQEDELLSVALALSRRRHAAAAELSDAVRRELADLNLPKTEFLVEVQTPRTPAVSDVGPMGCDRIQFLFGPNVGEPARALSGIASGGELSRVMLAIRAALAKKTDTETIVFDEIDAGIGGEVAGRVGKKLKALAARGQVLAITHFPQIAALADHHFVADKSVEGNTTVTSIREVGGEARIEEITRMLGGERKAARCYAAELVAGCRAFGSD